MELQGKCSEQLLMIRELLQNNSDLIADKNRLASALAIRDKELKVEEEKVKYIR